MDIDNNSGKLINNNYPKQKAVHVLLVDDEDFLVRIWKHVIEKRGYEVTSFTNGRYALEKFKSCPESFDLVITDQTMPEITGCEIAEEIMKLRKDIKILICSGYLGEIDNEKVIGNPKVQLLLKPFNIVTLMEAIERNI